jgi:thiamine-monophosphate kinase
MSDGEFDRVERLRARFRGPVAPSVGIGDDAALLVLDGATTLAVTVDASVEGVHFRRAWAPLDALAARAVNAALSDLAAKSADPSLPGGGVLFALELPAALSEREFDQLIEGLARGAEQHGAPVLGGNLSRASGDALAITTTAIGATRAGALRSGARPGDGLFVSGPLGAARVGVEALLAGRGAEAVFARAVRAWLEPRAHVTEGLALASIARAAIDVSDGLAQDAGHLARASGVRLLIEPERLPLDSGHDRAARALGLDPIAVALAGGEDYVLLFTAREGEAPAWATRIGTVTEGSGVWAREGSGARPLTGGWDHFR